MDLLCFLHTILTALEKHVFIFQKISFLLKYANSSDSQKISNMHSSMLVCSNLPVQCGYCHIFLSLKVYNILFLTVCLFSGLDK